MRAVQDAKARTEQIVVASSTILDREYHSWPGRCTDEICYSRGPEPDYANKDDGEFE